MEEIFKIIGGIIVKKDKKELNKELNEKVEDLKTRVDSLEKEESRLRDKLESKQEEIMKRLK